MNNLKIQINTIIIFEHVFQYRECYWPNFRAMKVGNPSDPSSKLGPLISKEHLQKVTSYVEIARDINATIRCGHGVDELTLPEENKKVTKQSEYNVLYLCMQIISEINLNLNSQWYHCLIALIELCCVLVVSIYWTNDHKDISSCIQSTASPDADFGNYVCWWNPSPTYDN